MRLAFVDCETTGLDPDRHEVWEVGLILREVPPADRIPTATNIAAADVESHWLLPVHRLGQADPRALEIGRFHERHPQGHYRPDAVDDVTMPDVFAAEFAKLTRGAHLVGAVISFDEERLRRLLQANGACPEWHYHLVDVEALVAGRYGLEPPWDSHQLGERAGVVPDEATRHTALGDARWARDMYDRMMTGFAPDRRPVEGLPRTADVDVAGSGFTPAERPAGAGW